MELVPYVRTCVLRDDRLLQDPSLHDASLNTSMLYERIQRTAGRLLHHNLDIGIYVSGGIDSTVLLYTFCQMHRDLSSPSRLRAFSIPVGADVGWASAIVLWMQSRFGLDLNHTTLDYDQRLPSHLRVRSTLRRAIASCDFVLLGDTMNPQEIGPGPRREVSRDRRFVQPMIEWTKREVIALSQEINMPDELMALTNSCDFDSDCGHCWACTERAWGFAANDLRDPKVTLKESRLG